jgi:hypothetical protein
LKATSCITQALPFCVAVAAYEPVVVTLRSSVRLPDAADRVVHPEPALVTVLRDAPAPKSRSLALVVVTEPLLIALLVPMADVLTSSGLALSMPAYSWM